MNNFTINNNRLTIQQSSDTPIILNSKDIVGIEHIVLEQNQKACLIELFEEQKEQSIEKTIHVQNNATLEYIKIQNNEATITTSTLFDIKEEGTCIMHNVEYGTNIQTNHFKAKLDVPTSNLFINGLVKISDTATCNNHFDIVHIAQHTYSDIAYKHSLDDQVKVIFQAKTIVENSALYSKAFQNSNTLLLSDDATIFTQPHLEIEIDELQASHGATTGSLNKDEMLYLQSRGIEKNAARNMLLKAFENEILDKIENITAKEYVKNYKRKCHD